MRILISNFRGIEKATYAFDEQLILINGPSGIGKSSVFNAISWALYGALRGVDPHGVSKPKVSVSILGLCGLSITRKKNPGHLLVLKGGKEYEDDVAQTLIDAAVGPPDLWSITGHIPQNERNALLTSSNSNKIDVLRQLAFPDSNPEAEIEKIDSFVKKAAQKAEAQRAAVQALAVEKAAFESEHKAEYLKADSTALEAIDQELASVKAKLGAARDKNLAHEKKKAVQVALLEQEKQLSKELKALPVIDPLEIEKMEEEILHIRNTDAALELKRRLDSLSERLAAVAPLVKGHEELKVKESMVRQARSIESEYSKAKSICDKVEIELSKEEVEENISFLEQMLEAQPYLGAKSKLAALQKELSLLPQPAEEKTDLDLLKGELFSAKARSKLHSCPNCTASLIFDGKSLKKSKDRPSSEAEIKGIQDLIEKALAQEQAAKERQALLDKIQALASFAGKPSAQAPLLNEAQIKLCKNKISALRGISCFELPPIPSQVLEAVQGYQSLVRELAEVELRFRPYESLSLTEKANSISSLEKKISSLRSSKAKRQEREKSLESLAKRLDPAFDLAISFSKEVKDLEESLESLSAKKEQLKVAKEYGQACLKFSKEKEELDKLEKSHLLMDRLKSKAVLAQNRVLEETVLRINRSLREVGAQLFSSPISINLELFKRVKSTQQLKAQVNVSISYKGNEYASIDSLSGGEADRVSLAFTIALNQISSAPFLMLDECMASLDQDIREQCLESLRGLVGKTVLLINHDGVEGNFDSVARLGAP